jgi:hypothetical protein
MERDPRAGPHAARKSLFANSVDEYAPRPEPVRPAYYLFGTSFDKDKDRQAEDGAAAGPSH